MCSLLRRLYELAPKLEIALELTRRFAALARRVDDTDERERWMSDAGAAGWHHLLRRPHAVSMPSTNLVERQINRLKPIKRQM